MEEKLVIKKKNKLKGDDGYKVFSVRIKDETVTKLELNSDESNRSRNEIINALLDFAISRCEIDDEQNNPIPWRMRYRVIFL